MTRTPHQRKLFPVNTWPQGAALGIRIPSAARRGCSVGRALGALADLLRCRVDAEPQVWSGRFERALLQAEASGQHELVKFLQKCRHAYETQS